MKRTRIIIACVLLLVFVIIFVNSGKKYMTPINKLVDEINKGEKGDYIAVVTSCLPDSYQKNIESFMKSSYFKSLGFIEEYETILSDYQHDFEYIEEHYKNWKVSFDVSLTGKMNDIDLIEYHEYFDELWEDYFSDYIEDVEEVNNYSDEEWAEFEREEGVTREEFEEITGGLLKYAKSCKNVKVTEGYRIKGRYLLKNGASVVDETNESVITIIKVNGEWLVADIEDEFEFQEENEGYYDYGVLDGYFNNYYHEYIRVSY